MKRIALYVVTLCIEFLFGLGRVWIFFSGIVWIFFWYFLIDRGNSISFYIQHDALLDTFWNVVILPSVAWATIIAYLNILASLHAFSGYNGGSLFTRFVLGARKPSRRENEQIQHVLQQIVQRATSSVLGVSDIFIIDRPFEYANLIGTTLYLSSTAINSDHFQVLLAHELGHHQNSDGDTILALRRLVFPLFQFFTYGIRDFSPSHSSETYQTIMSNVVQFMAALWGGGVAVWFMSWLWAAYFRECDYTADEFVASIGLAEQLIEYLEQNKFYDTSVPYMLAWQPAHELRIDKLLHREEA